MKKWLIIGGILLILVIWSVSSYNGLVGVEADAKTAWSKVESSYQRRNDLIQNLVNTVQGAADFEKSTLTEVTEARAKATSINIDPSKATPEQLAQFQEAQNGVMGAFSKLLVSVERYPDLKATQNFRDLQSQIEGTENRINVERDRYNDAVNIYDIKMKKFPTVIFAKLFGFNEMSRFKADAGAEKTPKVQFDFKK
ncbi:MAG: LemA family protein [Flavobacterium sp.]|uniref:LemA family protein n=1 Tax=Flavobacterium sp. Leaf359 TaxID=1736351 RepID=UPI0006F5B275|nr:LemA family protein [Flavobacterium sp. Leaf359]KQS47191.1 LemA family protein [Flavobacterium sp. Leaf359]MBU7571650.1 LemA family protein [Flavobacterium sp.]PZO32757.1 MAG: LemA family protein [Flavobacteriaceae bacterium]PZQ90240.1 MAG: LemA family protein [Flavobacterium johnsoniae]